MRIKQNIFSVSRWVKRYVLVYYNRASIKSHRPAFPFLYTHENVVKWGQMSENLQEAKFKESAKIGESNESRITFFNVRGMK